MAAIAGTGATPERREGVVLRPDLFARLEGAQRVTLLSASAGSGKSYLLRSWIRSNAHVTRAAWVTIDALDPTPERLWVSVVDALRATESGAHVHPLTTAPELDGWSLAERVLDDLETISDTVWLVIDDLHELTAADAVAQLEVLVMRAPPSIRFVLATRRDPAIALYRLRLEGELTELRTDDLRFTLDEARALFAEVGISLSERALTLLVDKTEGWVAGLRLAALCLVGHPDPDEFARVFSGSARTVADYLMAEVLDRQPEAARRLLLSTSLLDQVSGALADHVTGTTGGEAILQELESANAFVTAVDPARTLFRYHPLFAELLQSILRREEPDRVAPLYRSAAEWYADNGFVIEAVRSAKAAEDWRLAKQVLLRNWFTLYLDGRLGVAGELLAGFPPAVVAEDAIIPVLVSANELLRGSVAEAERSMQLAVATLDGVDAEDRTRVEIMISLAKLVIARERGDLTAAVQDALPVLQAATGAEWVRLGLSELARVVALTTLGVAELWSNRLDDAETHLEQAAAMAHRIGRPFSEVTAMAYSAVAATTRDPELAERRSVEALALASAHGWSSEPIVTMAHLGLATSLVWRGRLDEAEAELEIVCPAIRPEARPIDALAHRFLLGLLKLARGRADTAAETFERARRMDGLVAMSHVLLLKSHALWLHCLLRLGETERAAIEVGRLAADDRATSEIRTVTAAVHLARGEPARALEELAPVVKAEVPMQHPAAWRIQPLLLAARAHDDLSDDKARDDALEAALAVAEKHGEILPFLLDPQPELLARHRGRGTSHAALVTQILDVIAGRAGPVAARAAGGLTEPLTASETRVLRYLPTNLTRREIANEMHISENTVKTHVRHVYDKLSVERRGDAVTRARALGLLAPSTGR